MMPATVATMSWKRGCTLCKNRAATGDLIVVDAGNLVGRGDGDEFRFGGAAVVDRQRAARGERAAGRQRRQRRGGPRDGDQTFTAGGVEPGYRTQ